jgi:hypothetical protein
MDYKKRVIEIDTLIAHSRPDLAQKIRVWNSTGKIEDYDAAYLLNKHLEDLMQEKRRLQRRIDRGETFGDFYYMECLEEIYGDPHGNDVAEPVLINHPALW